VRVDRSDPADGSGSAYMALRVRSGPDNQDAACEGHGKAVGGDGSPDSSPASLDSALHTERAAAYHAAVDTAYRQYAMDQGYARAEKPERETSTPAMRRTETEGPERANDSECATIGTAAEYVLTGARGPASGREFDPEKAGGPIQQLDAGKARITNEGVQGVAAHLQRFTGGGSLQAPEQGMLDRLTCIAAGDIEPTSYDLNFFTHELDEASRYAQLGFGPESGVDLGRVEMYEVWNDVHTATLEDYGISDADLFHPGLAP